MATLGISAFYHDAAAAIVNGDEIVSAAQEERFSRIKFDRRWPEAAIAHCIEYAGARPERVAFYDNPNLTFDRLIKTVIDAAPESRDLWEKAAETQFRTQHDLRTKMRRLAPDDGKRFFVNHHTSHAASAFYPSPFSDAAVLVVDGVGEWATTSIFRGHGDDLDLLETIEFPHSLGLLYSAFTSYCGFKVNSGEYKLMGLAAFGSPRFAELIRDSLVGLRDDGSFALNMEYFEYHRSDRLIGDAFAGLFGKPPRKEEAEITGFHADIAASVQHVLNEAMTGLARRALSAAGSKNLCLAGGVALNCVANQRIRQDAGAEGIWVQPAAGDAGGALGAALFVERSVLRAPAPPKRSEGQKASLLGPAFSAKEVKAAIQEAGLSAEYMPSRAARDAASAEALAKGNVIGLFQGRMEFGPRALGARSIIADPRTKNGQSHINRKIKFRESWRPFAPAILEEHVGDWFESEDADPYMLFTRSLKAERRGDKISHERANPDGPMDLIARIAAVGRNCDVPAIAHVDGTARVQTVSAKSNPAFHGVIAAFHEWTGCPMVVNTSFNVRGEPIVCTPHDAIACFKATAIDVLVLEDFVVRKPDEAGSTE